MRRLLWLAACLACAAVVSGCLNDPIAVSTTTNAAVPVALLFEHDGCRVYRFTDNGQPRYYVRCPEGAAVMQSHRESCGKSCTSEVPDVTQVPRAAR